MDLLLFSFFSLCFTVLGFVVKHQIYHGVDCDFFPIAENDKPNPMKDYRG